MFMWNPWRGCHRCSKGCKYCYIHKGDTKHGIDTNQVIATTKMNLPIEKYQRGIHRGEYKIPAGETIYVCFSSDFLIEEADEWRTTAWQIMKQRPDVNFLFLTKRIERFTSCIPDDWKDGYENVIVGVSVENQEMADKKLSVFKELPIKHKNIICQPLIEMIDLHAYLQNIELVVVGGESDRNARILNYDWVVLIRQQCIEQNVAFTFRQLGTHFFKDGITYHIPTKQLISQAKKACIDYLPKNSKSNAFE